MFPYDFSKIEKKWQKTWQREKIYEPDLKRAKKPFYNLMMFPYPSAEGLHVGNMYAFTGSDIYGRFKRMQGYDVFEPIGLDGFGIHSENYALKIGVHPMEQAEISEKRFYGQLQMIGNGFSWEERLETYDQKYYKWTQWIFIKMFKNGLAYRQKSLVNWCPSCRTVLADEQVISGECERCGSKVIKKELEQWFFKITNYAERLLKDLDRIDWTEKVKIAQRNWIGRSEGALINFPVPGFQPRLEVFTTRPDTLYGATYLVLAPEQPLLGILRPSVKNWPEVQKYIEEARSKTEEERIAEGKEKTGIELKGVKAVNPATKKKIPIWVADYVLGSYGTGAIMAVPAHDERDFEFARKHNLPVRQVIKSTQEKTAPCYTGEGVIINSGKFNGLSSQKARKEITKFVGGEKKTHYRLRDWLISRQRYWGPPIPMIYCKSCAGKGRGERKEMPGWYAVPEKNLPVKLPFLKNYRPTGAGTSPLASEPKFYQTKCPGCSGPARRETDVSDTFLDSAWYFFRYLDTKNKKEIFSKTLARKWLPVNMYIGGAEHSVLHLLYVRFLTKVFHVWGLTGFSEPFSKFRAHGLIIKDGAKMSKSRGNVINPDNYIKNFGADAFRMYLMFIGPFEDGGDFRDSGILGVTRFLARIRDLRRKMGKNPLSGPIRNALHQSIKKITADIESLHYNTAVSQLMILLNKMEESPEGINSSAFEVFLKLLAPFAPYLAEELWQEIHSDPSVRSRRFSSIHLSKWPEYEERFIREGTFILVIQTNGKVRDSVGAKLGLGRKEAEKIAFSREKIKNLVGNRQPKRIIYVPNRLINIVF